MRQRCQIGITEKVRRLILSPRMPPRSWRAEDRIQAWLEHSTIQREIWKVSIYLRRWTSNSRLWWVWMKYSSLLSSVEVPFRIWRASSPRVNKEMNPRWVRNPSRSKSSQTRGRTLKRDYLSDHLFHKMLQRPSILLRNIIRKTSWLNIGWNKWGRRSKDPVDLKSRVSWMWNTREEQFTSLYQVSRIIGPQLSGHALNSLSKPSWTKLASGNRNVRWRTMRHRGLEGSRLTAPIIKMINTKFSRELLACSQTAPRSLNNIYGRASWLGKRTTWLMRELNST